MPTLNTVTLGKFCRELACGLSDTRTLLGEWGLSVEQYNALEASPGFKREMLLVLDEMKDLGADAGYIYRMKSLAEEQIAEVIKIMKDPATGVGTRVDLIKFVAEMARVKEKPAVRNGEVGPRGPQVIFHFGAGLPVQSMTLIPPVDETPITERITYPVVPPPQAIGAFGLPAELFE